MTLLEKRELFEEARRWFIEDYGEKKLSHGACVYWTIILIQLLQRKGIKAVPQAGTMNWPIVPAHLDDGVSNTHFGYVWSPNEMQSIMGVLAGGMPEVHVWVGLPETQEIIDFSTNGFRRSAEAMGHKWQTPEPPDYLWMPVSELPPDVVYKCEQPAVLYIISRVFNNMVQVKDKKRYRVKEKI